MHAPSFMQRFVAGLRYVLAVSDDGHDHLGLSLLAHRLTYLSSMRREYGLDEICWSTVHCGLHANPLTYTSPLHDSGGTATAADLAVLWREYLHQGLYVPTTGSHGDPHGRRALHAFASAPQLVSQVQLTITPTDPTWDDSISIDNLAEDLRILNPLWDLPADLLDTDTTRFHLVVQATDEDMPGAREAVIGLLQEVGMSRVRLYTAFNDPRRISFQPVGNHEPAATDSNDPLRTFFGIHTTGTLFSGTSLAAITTLPYSWDTLHRGATRAGWVA
jgi:hypothetical protein